MKHNLKKELTDFLKQIKGVKYALNEAFRLRLLDGSPSNMDEYTIVQLRTKFAAFSMFLNHFTRVMTLFICQKRRPVLL